MKNSNDFWKSTTFRLTLFLILFGGFFTGLKAQTVVDVIVNSDDHTTLETAVIEAGLDGTLGGDGPFTVFAPTDAAFDALPEGTMDALLEDPTGNLAAILLHHVVEGTTMSGDLSDGLEVTTLKGQDVTVSIDGDGTVMIDNATVTVADIETANGVVHVVDAVLMPEYDVQVTNTDAYGDILTDREGHSLYFFTKDAESEASSCTGDCVDNWPLFDQANLYLPEDLNRDEFARFERADGNMQVTFKGWPLYYFQNDEDPGDVNGEDVINSWYVAKPDYTVMLMDNQLVGSDGLNYTGDYEEGEEIVQYFVDDKGRTLYTFSNDFKNQNNYTAEDLSNNISWPVYEEDNVVTPSVLEASDFGSIDVYGKTQMTYKGWPLYYFVEDDMERGSNKGVSSPEPGVWPVAVADMMPALPATVVDVVVESENHTTLETAVIEAELDDDLSADGPFTVFAPTDAAFDALPEGVLDDLLDDPTGELAQILLYHVADGKVMSGDLSDGQMIETLQGEDVEVTLDNGDVFINDAQVTVADIEADNGVVHVIDAVLLPAEFTSVASVESGSEQLSVYPNPAKEKIHVDFSADGTGEVVFEIYNISGEMVTSKNLGTLPAGEHTFTHTVTDLPTGVYVLTVGSDDNKKAARIQVVE
ncbi:MAG: fasciclin domain-containing protein [Bacteroidota bacterium]